MAIETVEAGAADIAAGVADIVSDAAEVVVLSAAAMARLLTEKSPSVTGDTCSGNDCPVYR